MPDPVERFLAAATAPLADNAELQARAAHELTAALTTADPCNSRDPVEQAAENIARKPRLPWRGIFYGLTAVVSVAALIPVAVDSYKRQVAGWSLFAMGESFPAGPPIPFLRMSGLKDLGLFEFSEERDLPALFGEFSPHQRLLLFGDLSESGRPGQFKALVDSDPGNPAFYAEYVWRTASSAPHLLPPDYLATADRLDPRNSWFRYFAAALAARDAVDDRYTRPKRPPLGSTAPPYPVRDPAKLNEAISLLEAAAQQPDYHCYFRDLLLRRLAILPAGDDVLRRKFAREFVMWCEAPFWIHRSLARVVATQAYDYAVSGDVESFLRLAHAWELCCRRAINNADSGYVEVITAGGGSRLAAGDLAKAAQTLHLDAKAAHFSRLEQAFEERSRAYKAREYNVAIRDHGGMDTYRFANLAQNVANPPPITDANLRPSRLAEHSMVARFLSAGALLSFLALSLATALARFRHGKLARLLSASLLRALGPADYLWILGIGVLLPLVVFQLVEQCTPFGGGDFGIQRSVSGDLLRILSLLVVMATLPAYVTGRRLGKRLGCLDWQRRQIPILVACGTGIAAWLAGCVVGLRGYDLIPDSNDWPQWCFGTTALFALAVPICCFLAKRDHALRWLTCCRATIPATVFAMLLMAFMIPVHHAIEKHHIRHESLSKVPDGIPALNRYDYEIGRLIRAELLEILDAKP